MITICHVVKNLDISYGGPARSVPALCNSLAAVGVRSVIFALEYNDHEENELLIGGDFDVVTCKRFFPTGRLNYSFGLTNNLERVCREYRVDIIHCHTMWNYLAFSTFRVKLRLNLPLMISPRSNLMTESLRRSVVKKKIAAYAFQDSMIKQASMIHATSDGERTDIQLLNYEPPIVKIPNGVDVLEFSQRPKKREALIHLGLDIDRNYILFLSRIDRRKNLELLVDTWIDASKLLNRWDLIVAGPVQDPAILSRINSKLAATGKSSSFHYLGVVDGEDRASLFSAADIFWLVSEFENFGMSIAEALACQLPVIVTKRSPWADASTVGYGESLLPDRDEALMSLLCLMKKSEDQREKMGAIGRSYVEEKYQWSQIASRMKKAYMEILD